MKLRRVLPALTAVTLALGGRAAAQAPRVRVEFLLVDSIYRNGFHAPEISQIEDSGTAMVVRVLSRHVGFLSFTRDPADTSRVLLVILDQRVRTSNAHLGERGLWVIFSNPPADSVRLYWRKFRELGFRAADTVGSMSTFLGELGLALGGLDGAAWNVLVTDVLSTVSIADANAVAWAPGGAGSQLEWLIPLRPESACFDPDSRLRIYNRTTTSKFTVPARPVNMLPQQGAIDPKYERYRGMISAPLDTARTITAPPESIEVRAVKVTKYKFDDVECATLAGPGGGQ